MIGASAVATHLVCENDCIYFVDNPDKDSSIDSLDKGISDIYSLYSTYGRKDHFTSCKCRATCKSFNKIVIWNLKISRPVMTIEYQPLHCIVSPTILTLCVAPENINRELKHRHFWDANGYRKANSTAFGAIWLEPINWKAFVLAF